MITKVKELEDIIQNLLICAKGLFLCILMHSGKKESPTFRLSGKRHRWPANEHTKTTQNLLQKNTAEKAGSSRDAVANR